MYRYIAVKEKGFPSGLNYRDTYMILAEQYKEGKWVAVAAAANVSCDYELVAALAELCTKLQLNPKKLPDIISSTFF